MLLHNPVELVCLFAQVREVPLDKALWMRGFAALATGAQAVAAGASAGGSLAARAAAGGRAPRVAALVGGLSAGEAGELLGVAGERGLRLRTEVLEVMLAAIGEGA
jgi:hypothetical protein